MIKKNKGGRPTKYRDEFCEKVDEYLRTIGKEQMHLPKLESFAILLDVDRSTLNEWAKKHKRFSHALEKILRKQAEQLIDDGIYGGKEVNSTIVKLLLMNNHGMREKSDTDVTTLGKPLQIIQVTYQNKDGK